MVFFGGEVGDFLLVGWGGGGGELVGGCGVECYFDGGGCCDGVGVGVGGVDGGVDGVGLDGACGGGG